PSTGRLGLAHRDFSLNDYHHHIVRTLRKTGYYSALIGEQHISKEPDIIGYDQVFKIHTSHVDSVAPLTIDILRNAPPQPFFLSVGFFETHREFFEPTSPQGADYCLPPRTITDTPQTRQDMAVFITSPQSLESGKGAVIDPFYAAGRA